ncbi:MAG: HAMP domain-containing sensor histidine kinase [Eubacteriales bacterium]|nr:HAMP domain-containing sensor histidine kinase [Eubacteriales bacterium]
MKRSLIIIIHMLSVLLAVAGLSVLYISSPGGYGLSWTVKESYEETPQFSEKLNDDIAAIKELAQLRDAFENNGELDMENVVAETDVDGTYTPVTLRDAMQNAQKFGCYLDPQSHALTIGSVSGEPKDYEVKVTYKYYDPDYFDSISAGPGVGVTTVREFSIEIMRALSRYYTLKSRYIGTEGNLYFEMRYMNAAGDYVDFYNTSRNPEELTGLGKYIYVRGDSQNVDTNIDPVPENALDIETEFNPNADENDEYNFFAVVDTAYPYPDSYRRAALRFEGDIRKAYLAAGMLMIGLLLSAMSMVLIVRFDGYPDREAAYRLRPADRLPYEIYLFLCAVAAAAGLFLMSLTGFRIVRTVTPEKEWYYWYRVLNALVIYAVAIYAMLGTIRREYAGGILKNTLIHGFISDLNGYAANRNIAGRLFVRFSLFVGGNLFLCLMITWLYIHRTENSVYLIIFAAGLLILAAADLGVFRRMYTEAKQQDSLDSALIHMSEGNTAFELDTEQYSGREKVTAERLNHISTGIREALSEQVKSERLKADLITNVSHDIRTPLTSIINYVDLLKRESDSLPPRALEYVEVLEKKSARLKNLTEDLLEASKASSGNIKLDMNKINLVELAIQAGAEFEDKFTAKGLELCLDTPEHPVYILADGRHLWRVLENLYNNAAKYSMEHTRVYAAVSEADGNAVFTIKNVSAAKLNISPDELTERFVRGDVSRTTDGSGLGLSIAKSLAALQGGELRIEIDGDLYKANVIFPLYAAPETDEEEVIGG